MHKLEERQQQLIASLLNDISKTISLFKALVNSDSDISNELILVEARLISADKKILQGTIKDEDLQIEYNKIRASILQMINSLEVEDLKPNFDEEQFNKQHSSSKPSKNQGSILYHIPDVMAVDQEAKCVIRIAFDEEILTENFEVTVETEIENIRVSEVMQVDMIDPSDNEYFQIRTYSSKEQIVDIDAYTEWVYYVKPIKAGTYPLILKVAVIELIRDKERKREIVLEEQIQIVAEKEKAEETPVSFKTSDESIRVGGIDLAAPPSAPLEDDFVSGSEALPVPGVELPSKSGKSGKSIPFEKIQKKSTNSLPEPQRKAPSDDFSFSSGRRRIPVGSILTVVGLLIASSWLIFAPAGKKNADENFGDGTEGFFPTDGPSRRDIPVLDTVFCGADTLSLDKRLSAFHQEIANSEELKSPDGVQAFYGLLTFLQMQCPNLQFPSFTTYRTPTDIAQWYHENGSLRLADFSVQRIDELPNGTILFKLKKDVSLSEGTDGYIWEEGPITRIDIFMKGDSTIQIDSQAYLISSIILHAEQ